jgi:hypothetical protein
MSADMITSSTLSNFFLLVIRFFLRFVDGREVLQEMMADGLSGIMDSSYL